ncbi:MAG TPA: ribosome maturation factor RimM [Myxococcota bacterium]|nr:ribosome maturation factor RimM [Myxococcota bacterium]
MAATRSAEDSPAPRGPAEADWVELGRVVRPHGLDGGLLVALHGDDPANLLAVRTLRLVGDPGAIPFVVERCEPAGAGAHGSARVRLWLRGLDTRERAERFAGAALQIRAAELAELPEGEFYWRDLIGLTARGPDGARLGVVAEILPTAGADVLVIRRDGPDLLLPAIEGMVARLDRESRELWLDPPAGLLEAAP